VRVRGPARLTASGARLLWRMLSALPSRGPEDLQRPPLGPASRLGIPRPAMTAHSFALPVIIFTTFWGLIGIAGPWFVPKGPNRGVIITMLVATAVCCYLLMTVAPLSLIAPSSGPSPAQLCLVFSSLLLAPRDPACRSCLVRGSLPSLPRDVLLQYPHCSGVCPVSRGDAAEELVRVGSSPLQMGQMPGLGPA
uniref:Uncharacterized protein n=1 Tax=Saimiri boliviensis boliviensis TaxID=39432 RepID=A0A2K6UMY3_SAIBB